MSRRLPIDIVLTQFIDSFKKAVSMDMDTMHARMGPFEVPLGQGGRLDDRDEESKRFYQLTLGRSAA